MTYPSHPPLLVNVTRANRPPWAQRAVDYSLDRGTKLLTAYCG